MEDVFYILLGLGLILAFPALAIIALVNSVRARDRLTLLEEDQRRLRLAVDALSGEIAARRPAAGAGAAVVAAAAEAAEPAATAADHVEAEPAADRIDAAADVAAASASAVEDVEFNPSPASPPPPPAQPAALPLDQPKPERSFEEALGTRWTVWVGGLALALGGVFLVKYSIEQGFFGPAARIVMAALFSAALLAAGEFLRRREIDEATSGPASVQIPSILTAAGVVASFATVYGAYALYGFLGPASAFVLLGLVAFGAMIVSLLHGPWIAVLGVLGAYATPLLIQTDHPDRTALTAFLLAVTLAALAIARLKLWRWVATAAMSLVFAWCVVIAGAINDHHGAGTVEFGVLLLGLTALVAGILVTSIDEALDPPQDRPLNGLALASLFGLAFLAFVLLQLDDFGLMSRLVTGVSLITGLGLAWRYPSMAPATVIGGLLALFGGLTWSVNVQATLDTGILVQGVDGLNQIRPKLIGEYEVLASATAALFLAAGFLGARRSTPQADRTSGWFAGAGALVPGLMLIAAWLRIDGWVASPVFAGLSLGLAGLLAAATRELITREWQDRPSTAVAVYAIGTIAALASGLTIALERGALTIALALIVPAIAWVYTSRPIAVLKPLAALVGVLVLARVGWDPRIVGDDLGTTPIVNWLLYGYGVPAISLGVAAHLFRRRTGETANADLSIGCLEALTIFFTGALVVLEIRHLVHGGDVFAPVSDVSEQGLIAAIGLIGSAALTRFGQRLRSPVYDAGAIVVWALSAGLSTLGLLATQNPGLTGELVGTGLIFNSLLTGYLVPAIAAATLSFLGNGVRPKAFVAANSAIGLALAFAYVTLMTRHLYQGSDVAMIGSFFVLLPHATDAEFWSYSAVWLVFGILTLAGGMILKSPTARIASAAIILLTVAKVFLIDMSALTGIFRAFSFIGLGVVLIGIGALYQKLLFRGKGSDAADTRNRGV